MIKQKIEENTPWQSNETKVELKMNKIVKSLKKF